MEYLAMLFLLFVPLGIVLLAAKLGKYYLYISVAVLILFTTIIAGKIVPLAGLMISAGTPLYAAIFLSTDILSELYDKNAAKRAVLIGFFVNILFVGLGLIVLQLPSLNDPLANALNTLFNFTPRLVLGGMIAYVISQNIDVFIFHKVKERIGEKHLWLRNNVSTVLSQGIDTTLVYTIAFAGIIPELWKVILINWIVKVVVAVADTPFLYIAKRIGPQHDET